MNPILFLLIVAVICGGVAFLGMGLIFLFQKKQSKGNSRQAFRGQILIFILISTFVGVVVFTKSDLYQIFVSSENFNDFISLWELLFVISGEIFIGNVFFAQFFACTEPWFKQRVKFKTKLFY
jgi:hypothetical protein